MLRYPYVILKGDTSVDLSVKSEENVEYMVEAIKENYVWLMLER